MLLNQAIQGSQAEPAAPVEAVPQATYVRPVRVDPNYDRMMELRDECDAGSRKACVNFGILIGQRRERQAQLRRMHPELFEFERY